ncbi:unnamed protein product [Blepharisma stoltei]|uniref:Uncharacterized protein n=1 Tax=Blepharisma stoltei TaxID=1481888 RepID=A0AAU9IMQ4_9CILI|nr:unnamed protein product [Blepharisma stoltei]
MKQQDIEKIKKIRGPKLSINSIDSNFFSKIFNLEPSSECFDYRQNYYDNSKVIKFVWRNWKNIIGTFDIETLQIYHYKHSWNHYLDAYGIKCLLPDSSVFCSQYENCFIIDSLGNIKSISTYKNKSILSAIYVGGCIFACCNGFKSWAKYIIQRNEWSELTPLPQSLFTESALFQNYILLGSNSSSKIIYYDMLIDCFSEISLNLKQSTTKTIVVQDRRIFIIEFSQYIYESTDNLITWNTIGECSELIARLSRTSYPIFYKEKIYFLTDHEIYAFDINERVTKSVAKIDFSHKFLYN